MAHTLTSSIRVSLAATEQDSGDLSTLKAVHSLVKSKSWPTGTGNSKANAIFTDQRTLAASTGEDIDLAGSLVNAFGQTVSFTKIKAIVIHAASGNTNAVRVTRPASNGFPLYLAASDGEDLKPDAIKVWTDPVAGTDVTADTGDLIHIANAGAGTSVTYEIWIEGEGTVA